MLLIAEWAKSEREDLERGDYQAIGQVVARIPRLVEQGKIS